MVFTRWGAIRLGLRLIWFATGTDKVQLSIYSDGLLVEGADYIREPHDGTGG